MPPAPVVSAAQAFGAPAPSPSGAGGYGAAPSPSASGAGSFAAGGFGAGGGGASVAPPARPSHAPAPRRGPPTHLSVELRARWQEIEQKSEKLEKESFFDLLGVAKDATEPQVQAAYFKLAKSWHPDRLPPELAELKTQVSTIFAALNEAFNTLNDPIKRHAYVKDLERGDGETEADQVQRVVDAAIEFQKAEVMLKKNDLAAAESFARRATMADPDQIEYIALVAWIQAMKRGDPPILPEGKTSTFYDDLLSILDGVLAKDPMFEKALYYRAVLLKRSGREDKAMRDFKMAVQINPKNIDAVREVRLFQMRKDKKRKDEAGLLGKLFKK
jgi:curved DNA-binding protein CbpA